MDDNFFQQYLGDGVYAIFNGDGFWLHVSDLNKPTDRVYLEPKVLAELNRFVKHCHERPYIPDWYRKERR